MMSQQISWQLTSSHRQNTGTLKILCLHNMYTECPWNRSDFLFGLVPHPWVISLPTSRSLKIRRKENAKSEPLLVLEQGYKTPTPTLLQQITTQILLSGGSWAPKEQEFTVPLDKPVRESLPCFSRMFLVSVFYFLDQWEEDPTTI